MLLSLRSLWEAAGQQSKSDADVAALADLAVSIFLAGVDDPVSLQDAATLVTLLTPNEVVGEADAATLLAILGVDEPISAADAASLIALATATEGATVTESASIGISDADIASLADAVASPLVVVGPDEMAAVIDAVALVAVGTPAEAAGVADAVVDIVQFESISDADDASVADEVVSIVELKPPPPAPPPASGGAPSYDRNRRTQKPLPPLKVKRVPLEYEPAPLPLTIGPARFDNRHLKRMDEVTRLMALHQLGLLTDDELEALAAAA